MARVMQKGQVTIPKEIRDALGVEVGDEISFRKTGRGTVEVVKASRSSPFQKYKGALKHLRGKKTDEVLNSLRGPAE